MTESFDTDTGVAAWIRKQITMLADTEVYEPGPEGDANLIEDFTLTMQQFSREREHAVLARIRATNKERDRRERILNTTPKNDVSLPWLSGK